MTFKNKKILETINISKAGPESKFSPLDVGTPIFWHDVSQAEYVVRDPSDDVSSLIDLTFKGWDASQAVEADQPDYLKHGVDGNASVKFDGISDYFEIPAAAFDASNGATLFMCTAFYLDTTENFFGNWVNASNQVMYQALTRTGGDIAFRVQNGAGNYIGRSAAGVFALGELNNWTFTYDGGTSSSGVKIFCNGIQVDTTDEIDGTFPGPRSSTTNDMRLSRQAGKYNETELCETAYYQPELETAAIDLMHDYLNQKRNLYP